MTSTADMLCASWSGVGAGPCAAALPSVEHAIKRAAFNSASVIAVLIASKSDVNAQGFLQQTPLHRAAEMNEEAVPLLLEAKANVNILDKKQRSPLFFAAKRKHEQSVILLCKAGADPNLGVSPLNHYSIDDSMKALIKKHRERWELLN